MNYRNILLVAREREGSGSGEHAYWSRDKDNGRLGPISVENGAFTVSVCLWPGRF